MNDRPPACPQIMTDGPAAHCAEQVLYEVLYCTVRTVLDLEILDPRPCSWRQVLGALLLFCALQATST
jgi:hypothetical protein